MRLLDRKVSLGEIKRVLPFDPVVGCSLADVARAADALGFATEIRFVNPQNLPTCAFPLILHKTGSLQRGIGHFAVVVGYSPERRLYSSIDTSYEQFQRVTEEALLTGYSGYVLVPKEADGGISRPMLSAILVCIGGIFATLAFFARVRSR
jgi:ABC-type bacteriocin/lantibiotic exporter with double-glycine peptidase domain